MRTVPILLLICCLGWLHEGQADDRKIGAVGPPMKQRSFRHVSSFANPGQPGRPGSGRPGRPGQGMPGRPGRPGGSGGAGGAGGSGADGGASGAGGRAVRGGYWRKGISLGQRRPEPRSKYYLY
ncbi:translation initiation factor IF-2 [Drosophila sechellia]|uniref:translation initiation factor IF-2 n=1 Tax=Drosophila sechellia TaxID=7238 RepID=UPI0013DE571C|nr:translation initiation factor IF-2 [Drosophila sechellia]